MTAVYTLDLNFQGIPRVIAAYLIKHATGAALVESGPGSTLAGLKAALKPHDLTVEDITDVLLTHIHLDHAGAAGWLARHGDHGQGARIYAHPNGRAHLLNPEKLINSATRIYGPLMDQLWGELLAVPEDKLIVIQDQQEIVIDHLRFCPIDAPGHAEHHYVYRLEDTLFTGDVGGIRLPGPPHLRVPMPPPEFQLERWRASLKKMQEARCKQIAPTHFGLYADPERHFEMLQRGLDEVEAFMIETLPADPPAPAISDKFMQWTGARSKREGLFDEMAGAYEAANPSWMSATGMQRYWRKYRTTTN